MDRICEFEFHFAQGRQHQFDLGVRNVFFSSASVSLSLSPLVPLSRSVSPSFSLSLAISLSPSPLLSLVHRDPLSLSIYHWQHTHCDLQLADIMMHRDMHNATSTCHALSLSPSLHFSLSPSLPLALSPSLRALSLRVSLHWSLSFVFRRLGRASAPFKFRSLTSSTPLTH